jgi:predicted enzyme related to lactoylglutathione lyase
MDNPIVWFEIYVQDMPRARKFYEAVFQIKLQKLPVDEPEMWSFPSNMERSGASGTLVKAQGIASGGNSTLIYFGCQDCAVEEARVAKAGGSVKRKKMSIGQYGFVSLVFDTEGNMVGLHSMK